MKGENNNIEKILIYICIIILIIFAIAHTSKTFSQNSTLNVEAAVKKANDDFPEYEFEVTGYKYNFNDKSCIITLHPNNEKSSTYINYEVVAINNVGYYVRCTGGRNIDYLIPNYKIKKIKMSYLGLLFSNSKIAVAKT